MSLTIFAPLSFFTALAQPIFITGTDTDIGKTWCSCALLNYFNQQGLTTVASKPIASGCVATNDGLRNEDALKLQASASVKLAYEIVNPIALPLPIAPCLAAVAADIPLKVETVLRKSQPFLSTVADIKIMEGAGGWMHPLNDHETFPQLVHELGASVILVVGIKLGCINHALLTAQAIIADGCHFAGWIANDLIEDQEYAFEMINTLEQWMSAPLLARINFCKHQ